ncbi:MAG: hypothetical protein V4463_10200 [Pseudomonadota bacterium]
MSHDDNASRPSALKPSESPATDRRIGFNGGDLAYAADKRFFRIVVLFAGWTLVLSVGGMILLAAFEKTILQGLVAAASGLIGLLTGTFATRGNKK